MQAAYASPKASRPAPVVAPGEPEEVVTRLVTKAKKNRIRNALAANWREGRTALVSTYGFRLNGQKARASPSHRALVERVESSVKVSPSDSTLTLCLLITRTG